ncbi:MAG: Gfo/Idh/MocA family oxidoreductase [Gemmatimonadaceae bacterium]
MAADLTSPRVGIVGAGLMGRWHADAAQHVGSQVVVVVDADAKRASALSRRLHGRPAAATDLGQAIREQRVDVVHVCTPLASHETLAREAMLAGAHVLLEKPLTPDGPSTERLFALATTQRVLLCPVHQFLFQQGVLAAQRALPTLGDVHHLELVACSAGAELPGAAPPESVALDILPHGLALAGRLLERELASSAWVVSDGRDGEIRALAQVDHTSVMLTVSMGSRPTENSLTIRCDRGTVRSDLFHGFATIERGSTSRFGKVVRPFGAATAQLHAASTNLIGRAVRREPAYPGLRELVRRFHLAVQGRGDNPISAEESIDVARVRDTISRARALRSS